MQAKVTIALKLLATGEPGAEPTFFLEPVEQAFDYIALAVRGLIEEPR